MLDQASPRYRWAVLAAGSVAQASFSAFALGLPALAPALRAEFGLSLREVGTMLAVMSLGVLIGLIPSGIATDAFGERVVITVGLLAASVALAVAAAVSSYWQFLASIAVAGAVGTSVNAATGRAVMTWFAPAERGLALGIRQTSIPLAGILAAVTLPPLAAAAGVGAAFVTLSIWCVIGAVFGFAVLRDPPGAQLSRSRVEMTPMLRSRPLWRLSSASVLVCVAQLAATGFVVLFLHDARGVAPGLAALVLAASQAIGATMRIGLGIWSDHLGDRIGPFRVVSLALSGLVAGAAILADAPLWMLIPTIIVATGVSMGWNSLSFAAAAEIGGMRRSGAAIGFQQTSLAAVATVVPLVFSITVAATSWRTAFLTVAVFPLLGWWMLRRLTIPAAADA